MSKAEWSQFPRVELAQAPEADISLKYALSFDWGSLRVSQAAHDAYGLVPLSENVISDNFPEPGQSRLPLSADIWLLSPEELEAGLSQEDKGPLERDTFGSSSLAYVHPRGICLKVGFNQGTESLQKAIKIGAAGLKETLGIEEDYELVNEDFIPLEESLDHDVPFYISHSLSSNLRDLVQPPAAEWLRINEGKHLLSGITQYAIGTVAAAALFMSGESIYNSGVSNAEAVTLGAGSALVFAGFSGSALYRYIKSANIRETIVTQAANLVCMRVASDVHDTYCTAHFDRKANDWPVTEEPELNS